MVDESNDNDIALQDINRESNNILTSNTNNNQTQQHFNRRKRPLSSVDQEHDENAIENAIVNSNNYNQPLNKRRKISTKSRIDHDIHDKFKDKEKPYQCSYPKCNKTYASRAGLRSHLKRHKGEGDHECKECGKKFYENCALQKHIKTVHRNERNFVCDQCGKKYKGANGLSKHKTIHMEWKHDFNSTKKPRKTTKKELNLKKKKGTEIKTKKTLNKMDVDKLNKNKQKSQSKQRYLLNTLENAIKEGYVLNHDKNGIYKVKTNDFQINLNANKLSNNTKIVKLINKIEEMQVELLEKITMNTQKAIECSQRFSHLMYFNKNYKDQWDENRVVHPPTMLKALDIIDLYKENKCDKTIMTTFYIQFDKDTDIITYVGYTQVEDVSIGGHYGYNVFRRLFKRMKGGYDRKKSKKNKNIEHTKHQKQLKEQPSSLRSAPILSINGYLSNHQALQIEAVLIHYFDPLCNSFDKLMEYEKNKDISYYISNILKAFENPSYPIGFIYSCVSSNDNNSKYVGKNIKSIPFEIILKDDVKLNDYKDVKKLVKLNESLTTRHYTSNRTNRHNMKHQNVDKQVCLMLVVPSSCNIFFYNSLICSMETIWMHQLETLQYVKWNKNHNKSRCDIKENNNDKFDKLNQISSKNLWDITKILNKKAICDACGYQMGTGCYINHFDTNGKCKFMNELRCKEFGCYEKFNLKKDLNNHQKHHENIDRLEKGNKSDWKVADQRHCHLRLGNKICRSLKNNVHNMMNSHKYRIHGIDYETKHICIGCKKKCPSSANLKMHQKAAICEDCQVHFDVNHVIHHKLYCSLMHHVDSQ